MSDVKHGKWLRALEIIAASLNLKSVLLDRAQPGAALYAAARKTGRCIMPLIQLAVVLIVVGVLLGLVNRFIPMAGSIKSILNAVVVIVVVLWLLNVFGLLESLSMIRVGR